MAGKEVFDLIKENNVEFVDLRFADMLGKQHHVTFPSHAIDASIFEDGKMFDGSSITGWKGINDSDMVLMPDAESAVLDPFAAVPTLILTCDVLEPSTMQAYTRCPRSVAKRAEAYLKSSGVADTAYFGPEPEFFIFDSVRWRNEMQGASFEIDSEEAAWSSNRKFEEGNAGHRPGIKGGYFPVAPVDSLSDMRSEICKVLEAMGMVVEVHHHEVATAGQCEIGTKFNTLTRKGDELLSLKYAIKNVAHRNGKTATFMPKPIVGDNGSGMHARAINAFTNSTTNSYKRLVPGFEAPVMLAYSARNRSASCRIPFVHSPKARRIEVRFPDPMNSGYLTFTALMMAGLDGILHKIDPGAPADKDLYELPPEEEKNIPTVCHSLDLALDYLDKDRAFLKAGGVFSDDFIDAYIELKLQEVTRFRMSTHPIEYQMYYSI